MAMFAQFSKQFLLEAVCPTKILVFRQCENKVNAILCNKEHSKAYQSNMHNEAGMTNDLDFFFNLFFSFPVEFLGKIAKNVNF